MDPAQCPPERDEVAEAYVVETLAEGDAVAFDEHLLLCARCRDAVEAADLYVRAMREAAAHIRQSGQAASRPR